jgi:hypothetical protein
MKARARITVWLCLLVLFGVGHAAGVVFNRVALTLDDDDLILLDAEIGFDLNETVAEALENGVPLTFETHVQMRRSDAWVWESDVVEHRLRTVLHYRPLSGLYELRSLPGEDRLAFATRDGALRTLGRIIGMPIVRRSELDLDDEYLVRLNVRLDIEALPLPMRPMAYLSSDWDVASSPWEWRLKP